MRMEPEKCLEIMFHCYAQVEPTVAHLFQGKLITFFFKLKRRYTSLNHLAQAARAVLQNPQQIVQMVEDLNRVDFKSIQEQAAWVCQCENGSVERLEKDFKQTLQQQSSLQDWAMWLESVIDQVRCSSCISI